ncbi:MAG: proline dehydrogenase family protein [Gemmatimonadota bacterium]|nr:proline dehydrogenase family protein [Gemmatimonadota bacterium]
MRKLLLFLSEHHGLKELLLRLPAARRVAHRFVAGDTLSDALRATDELNRQGLRVTLDYLGESVTDASEAEAAAEAYLESLEAIDRVSADATISLKLTQLGLDIDGESCARNLERIVARAAELGNFVRIDMEGSEHTDATLRLFKRTFQRHRNVGVVLQSYLYRSERDAAEMVRIGGPVRLCKGAYEEPESVAFQDKSMVDKNFVLIMKMLLDGGVPTAIATHDEKMIRATRRHAERRGIDQDRFEFQMLYGVRRDAQARLVSEGYQMRVYVPYGSEWYAYLMRRMAERPANLLFVLRALVGD